MTKIEEKLKEEFRQKFPYVWVEWKDGEKDRKIMQEIEDFWLSKLQSHREETEKKLLRLYDESYHHGSHTNDGSKTFITEKDFYNILAALKES